MNSNRNDAAVCKPVANIIKYIDEFDGKLDTRKAQQLIGSLKAHLERINSLRDISRAYQQLKQISNLLANAQDDYEQNEMSGIHDKSYLVGQLISTARESVLTAMCKFQYRLKPSQNDLFTEITLDLNNLFETIHKKYRRIGLMYVMSEDPRAVDACVEASIKLTAMYDNHQFTLMQKKFVLESASLLASRTYAWKSTSMMLADLSKILTTKATDFILENSYLLRALQESHIPLGFKKALAADAELMRNYLRIRQLLEKAERDQQSQVSIFEVVPDEFYRDHVTALETIAIDNESDINKVVLESLSQAILYTKSYTKVERTFKMFELIWVIKIMESMINFASEKQANMNEIEFIATRHLISGLVFPLNRMKPLVSANELIYSETKDALKRATKENKRKKRWLKNKKKNAVKVEGGANNNTSEQKTNAAQSVVNDTGSSIASTVDSNNVVKKEFDDAWLTNDKVFMKVYELLEKHLDDNKESPKLYVRGGMLRSLILGRPVRDIDIIVQADLYKIHQLLQSTFGKCELRPGPYPVIVVAVDNATFEICSLSAKLDVLANCSDITINSLFWNRHTGLVDSGEALADMRLKVIRNANPEVNFKADVNRMYRAVRFFHQLDFKFEEKTEKVIQQVALERQKYSQAYSPVRTYFELKNLFLFGKAKQVFTTLDKLDLLCFLLPFCKELNGEDKLNTADTLSAFDKDEKFKLPHAIAILLAILLYYPIKRNCPLIMTSNDIEKETSSAMRKVSSCLFFPMPKDENGLTREEHENYLVDTIKSALMQGKVSP